MNRIFQSKHALCDALNYFGRGYFSVCAHGVSYECSAGPCHNKKKRKTSEASGEDSTDDKKPLKKLRKREDVENLQ